MANEWRNSIRDNKIYLVDPRKLIENPLNWRTHDEDQWRAVEASLDKTGWTQPIILIAGSERILEGHLRARMAVAKGEETIPAIYVELTPEEEEFAILTINPLAGLAGAEPTALGQLLTRVQPVEGMGMLLDKLRKEAKPVLPMVAHEQAKPSAPKPAPAQVIEGEVVSSSEEIVEDEVEEIEEAPAPKAKATEGPSERYPLAVVLSNKHFRLWQEFKKRLGERSDSVAFVNMLEATMAEEENLV